MLSNKGTGAGGSNTNFYGKKFEEKTDNTYGYTNHGDYMSKKNGGITITRVCQNKFQKFIKDKYKIDLYRRPDEAYIIECESGRKIIKILEKKNQNREGSVETKLWAAPSLKREYEIVLGEEFEVVYGFCVSEFLQKKLVSSDKKYEILNIILNENNIEVLFGDDENYFERLDIWFNSSL